MTTFFSNIFILFSSLFQPKPIPEAVVTESNLVRLEYQDPNQATFLGVGLWAWPLPMDYDGDGDLDLLVSCPDVPFNGLYFFENKTGGVMPIFERPVKLGPALRHPQISYVNGKPRILDQGAELTDLTVGSAKPTAPLFSSDSLQSDFKKKPRFINWKMVDYDGDGDHDLVAGIDDWLDYGWDNAFNDKGVWTNGPLHGYVYLIENQNGKYLNKGRIKAGGEVLDVYGAPTPNFADYDGDGDLDLVCGEFLDKLTYFENIGSKTSPEYAKGKVLSNKSGIIKMDLEMIIPVSIDWDKDGAVDLIVGDEDGRVAFIRNTGKLKKGIPQFESPVYFKQKPGYVKFGALVTPYSVDWDDDGDEDIIAGNSAGYFSLIENKGGGENPNFAPPVLLKADGKVIRYQAGDNGSIQGPAEAKWGYTTLSVADWNGDGLKDLIVNSIWGKVEWLQNVGSKGKPKLTKPKPVVVDWAGNTPPKPLWNWWDPAATELSTQWRTTPYAIDWNNDKLMDLVMLDHEGYLAFFERINQNGKMVLKPGQRIFYQENGTDLLRLNEKVNGSSGRKKITFVDWDNDGDLDLIMNSKSADFYENITSKNNAGKFQFKNPVILSDIKLAGHSTSPTPVDWDKNGVWDLLIGAEDGHFYHLKR